VTVRQDKEGKFEYEIGEYEKNQKYSGNFSPKIIDPGNIFS